MLPTPTSQAAPDERLAAALSRRIARQGPAYRSAAAAREAWIRYRLSRLTGVRTPTQGDLVIAGLFSDPSGIARACRWERDALVDFTPISVEISAAYGLGGVLAPRIGPHGLMIVHANPPECRTALAMLGSHRLRHRRLVASWAWELDRVPGHWIKSAKLFDSIWAPSEFSAAALRRSGVSNVHVVPHPVTMERQTQHGERRDDVLKCLCAFSATSGYQRKNPEGALNAFSEAASDLPNARLIVKAANLDQAPDGGRLLRAAAVKDKRITLMTETLSDAAMDALIAASDVVISLHRSEGFGLLGLQAMLAGKALLITDWSATTAYTSPETAALVGYELVAAREGSSNYNGVESSWAEPNRAEAARLLRRLLTDDAYRSRIGKEAARASRQFAQSASLGIYEQMQSELACLQRRR